MQSRYWTSPYGVEEIEILNPMGTRGSKRAVLAPRPTSLKGLTVAYVENTKPGGRQLLAGLVKSLQGQGVAKFVNLGKRHASRAHHDIDAVARNCDVALVALGD